MAQKTEGSVPAIGLAYPVAGEKFVVDTDASAYGIGEALSQIINGHEKVIAYYSRALGKLNYCVTRLDLLAVVECVKHYLYGQRF